MIAVLEKMAAEYAARVAARSKRVIVCAGTGCMANGAGEIIAEFKRLCADDTTEIVADVHEDRVDVSGSGCQGFCQMGPLVDIEPLGIMYVKVQAGDVAQIVETTLKQGLPVERLLYVDPTTKKRCRGKADIPFYKKQHRLTLELCGRIDPEDMNEYVAQGGYNAAGVCLHTMTPQQICTSVLEAGLRGRGGGGFPTGKKWELARIEVNTEKYVICNGDEGDPGAFMDRSVMEGNPHSVVEGMLIAAKAIGAHEGVVYVRAEYPLAVVRMRRAVADAKKRGIIGENALDSGFRFNLEVMEGAGAFVCGEETALMASVMGRRGMPTPKPPFPSQQGLRGKPTIINNVETFATVAPIFRMGPQAFRAIGTRGSPGTKTFALTGHVTNTGLIEVPFGTTLGEIVNDIGGGVVDGSGNHTTEFKVVQIGGPSGGCLTKDHLDLPLDFDSLKSIGAMVGSGGLVVMNADTCIVQVAKYFMQFTQNESCGKCVPCREGTMQMLLMLEDVAEGRATVETLDRLEELARAVRTASLCGLGKTAPNPVLSTISTFRAEYLAHVVDKKCPSKQCRALCAPEISSAHCIGCGACVRVCPVGAITGEKRQPHALHGDLCIKCGACAAKCKFNAITGV